MRAVIPVLATLWFAVLATTAQKKDAATDQKALQGVWKVVKFEMAGSDMTARAPKEFKIEGDKIVGLGVTSTFKLKPAARLKEIDLIVPTSGDKKRVPGIYWIKGDELKICFPLVEKGFKNKLTRPTSFKTKSKKTMTVVARKKKAGK